MQNEGGEKGNANDVAVLEVEVSLDLDHLEYLIDHGFLLEEDVGDLTAVGRAVAAWLKSLAIN
jgi:hypothetical protein